MCPPLHHGGRCNSTPPPPKPRGGLAALAGRGGSQSGSGVRQHMHPPFKGEVECKIPALLPAPSTSIAVQPKAPLLLGPGPGQRASKLCEAEIGRRGAVKNR